MKIIKFRAENFQKLKVVEITPDGNTIPITGKCEQGKSTILKAIQAALGGGKMPEEPIRTGQKKATIEIDLADEELKKILKVKRTFTPSSSNISITNEDGFKASSPQELLDKLIGALSFDPLEFARADSKKQVEMLLSVVDLKVDMPHLQEISGVKLQAEGSPLDILNKYYAEVMENRKLTNRQLDSAKKILADMPVVEKVEAVSVTELVADKEKLQETNKQNQEKRNLVERQKLVAEQSIKNRDKIANDITELERQLAIKKEEHETSKKTALEEAAVYTKMHTAAEALQDEDLTEINTKIQNADATNKQAQQYINREAKQADVTKYQTESDDYTAKLKKIIEYKTEIVSKANFPVDGLDFVGGGVTYQGIPFKQASGSQTLKVSTAIGMALNPHLRVMLIDGAESLDSTQMKIISEMAKGQDFQLWLTRVSEDEKVGIYIEDGEIKTAEVAE